MYELSNVTTSCVTERINKITQKMEPLRIRFSDIKSALSRFMKTTADCVSDPKTTVFTNMACLTEVSKFFFVMNNNFIRKVNA